MRSALLTVTSFNRLCKRVFGDGLDMTNLPNAVGTTIENGGYNIAGNDIFFANGQEDPWQWASQLQNRTTLNQVARTSDCSTCGHCCELSQPKESDPEQLKLTRSMIATWIDGILGSNQTMAEEESYMLPVYNITSEFL